MNNLVEYAIESGISLIVLYLFYWLILRKDTHFRINRLVLMGSVLVSMVLPVVASGIFKAPQVHEILPSLAININSPSPQAGIEDGSIQIVDEVSIVGEKASMFSKLNIWKILALIYFAGAFIVIARLIYQAIFLHAITRLSDKMSYNGYTIVSMTTDMVPFSYFNRIFISAGKMDKSSFDSIIAHEKSHLSQGHFIDLFIIEIISVLQWFNPVVWLFERSIKEVHEYLADEAVLESGLQQGRYQALLVNQAFGGPVFILTNQFNQSLIKKSIMMMKNKKTSKMARFKALIIVPLMAALLLAFSNPPLISQTASGKQEITGNVTDMSTGKSISGCVSQIKGTTVGTFSDANGNYKIVVDNSDAMLVFSLIGYRTQVIPVSGNAVINVQLEQNVLAIDFSKGNQLIIDEKVNTTDKGKDIENQYVFVESLPGYPGGTDALHKFLMTNLRYPEVDKVKGIQGKVLVTFIIDTHGKVTGTKIIRGVSANIDKEAVRLANAMLEWEPASQNGQPKSMMVTMPVEFKLSN